VLAAFLADQLSICLKWVALVMERSTFGGQRSDAILPEMAIALLAGLRFEVRIFALVGCCLKLLPYFFRFFLDFFDAQHFAYSLIAEGKD
jgi:hypothetical protein